ncbi:hypothetical protein EYF80_046830 [Liparis tanakae]|uniref:Uncharacterized protein n=1 Tax=Liparis tanakae TaxID=230148 RepID=A0A4Z2FP14_9TELE|nr:hypothetical protein EYF80_046830 [Liparis tanakae]
MSTSQPAARRTTKRRERDVKELSEPTLSPLGGRSLTKGTRVLTCVGRRTKLRPLPVGPELVGQEV